ncbi:hypothetical protein Kpol_1014p21 [Vanderwaltozyma polyspora DSM 70294]|uniref:Major facilitator superfamily (MFS) profile domain-containing protein n=1 Tax=Vanderwaltozyma polyspora (strain ATCC 22028 / DSM 70294 / BCRC 21397 / CBS 2163 / NBRC 10782 / NRRL Y-8283 / UCD 57-17) TaxID=436907 RepID=A7TNE9_VANPO|nr:uncharacterized protein Kpol_1014p21 [Vanderwaltozyma polyspora DSM 70294]EDO16202.1 hypothetical protein Kpol_1014p21 [Vanderwaltozyma polyspora DSM 70294]
MSALNNKDFITREENTEAYGTVVSCESVASSCKDKAEPNDEPIVVNGPSSLLVPVLLCSMISFGGFIFGWDIGTIGGIVNMPSFQLNFGLSVDGPSSDTWIIGLVVSIFNIGSAIGGLTLAKLGDLFGRKAGLFTALGFYNIGLFIQLINDHNWYQFFIGRIFTGLAVGSIAVLVPMFISESAPLKIRGSMVCMYQLMITLGILLGNVVNYGCKDMSIVQFQNKSWQTPLSLGFAWAWIIAIGLIFIPESSQFLLRIKNDVNAAKVSFAKMNGLQINDEMTDRYIYTQQNITDSFKTEEKNEIAIESATDDSKNDTSKNRNLFEFISGEPKLGLRLFVGIMAMIFQQLSGINYYFYYGTSIFKSVGLDDPYITSILLSSVNFFATFGGIYFVEAIGRKSCLLVGSLGMFCCMMIYSSVGGFVANTPTTGAVLIIFTCVYICFFATTLGPVTYVLVSELFPLRTRAISMAVCTSFNWIFGFLISLFTPVIISKIGFLFGYVFAGCLLASAVFVWFLVPETKNKTEQEIDEMYT